jgi:hypothetical protein
MKRVLAVAAGIVSGVLLAGVFAPMLAFLFPERLRAGGVLWATMAVAIAAMVAIFWWASGPRRD